MNIQPLADRVLIKPAPAEEKTIGGIIIPDTAKEKTFQGRSDGGRSRHKRRRNGAQSGRYRALWQIFWHRNRSRKTKKYLIVRQSEVLAVVK